MEPSEKPAASVGVPAVEEEEHAPDPFLKLLVATTETANRPQKSPEDAAVLASVMAEGRTSSLTEARQAEQPMDGEATWRPHGKSERTLRCRQRMVQQWLQMLSHNPLP